MARSRRTASQDASPVGEHDVPSARISDPQYERELRQLEVQLHEQLAECEEDYSEAEGAERSEYLRELIGITGRFWYLKEKAYFECCTRNWHLLPGRNGRRPKHFKWFRVVRRGQLPRPGPRRTDDGERVLERALDLIRSGAFTPDRQQSAAVRAAMLDVEISRTTDRTRRANLQRLRRGLSDDGDVARSAARKVIDRDPVLFRNVKRAVSRGIRSNR
jgi:hypothetical protein